MTNPDTLTDRIAAYAKARGLRVPAARAQLLELALQTVEARARGAAAANASMSRSDLSAARSRAASARWAAVRAQKAAAAKAAVGDLLERRRRP